MTAPRMNRFWVGVLAVGSAAVAAIAHWGTPVDSSPHHLAEPALRFALLLAVVWLAAPDIQRLPPWAGLVVLGVVVGVFLLAKYIKYLIPTLGVLAFLALILRPRPPRGRRSRQRP